MPLIIDEIASNAPVEGPPSDHPTQPAPAEITPELVRQVADRVYHMLLQEAGLDYERRRRPARQSPFIQGG